MQTENVSLRDIHAGATVRITGFGGLSPSLLHRLFELGLTRGAEIKLCGTAPLGDPLILQVRGCRLALRKDDAAGIHVMLP